MKPKMKTELVARELTAEKVRRNGDNNESYDQQSRWQHMGILFERTPFGSSCYFGRPDYPGPRLDDL
jgi:hypothetical protein